MVVTNDDRLAARARQLKGQGLDPGRRYWFPIVGYNYRMTNVAAAIGLAQLEKVDWHLQRRLEVARWYREQLGSLDAVSWQAEQPWAKHAWWMFTVILSDRVRVERDAVMAQLLRDGIETRPVFHPMHTLPPYQGQAAGKQFPVAARLAQRGLSLPTWAGLTREDVDFICDRLKAACSLTRQLTLPGSP